MNTLAFASGNETYQVNDAVSITFNPASGQFAEAFLAKMDEFTKLTEKAEEETKRLSGDKQAVFEIGRELDHKIAEGIDQLFGAGVSAALFPWGPATAWAEGLPVWVNFCMAILEEMERATESQKQQTDPRIAKYVERYKRYQKK